MFNFRAFNYEKEKKLIYAQHRPRTKRLGISRVTAVLNGLLHVNSFKSVTIFVLLEELYDATKSVTIFLLLERSNEASLNFKRSYI